MKLRLLIIPVLMATALFAQGPGGGFGGRRGQAGGTGTPPAPPTAEQLATREANMISTALRLTTAQSTAVLAALAGASGPLTVEQTTLQGNAAALKAAWTAANGTIPSGGTDLTTINMLNAANLQARVTAAGAVLKALTGAAVTVTANQQSMLIRMLVNGGGGPGFRR